MIEVELPYPPSINKYWRRVGNRTLISRGGRVFRSQVVAILRAMDVEPMVGDLAICVDVYPPDRRRRDLDNVQKALFDALEHGGAYGNDNQIKRIVIERREPMEGGKACVVIMPFDEWGAVAR